MSNVQTRPHSSAFTPLVGDPRPRLVSTWDATAAKGYNRVTFPALLDGTTIINFPHERNTYLQNLVGLFSMGVIAITAVMG